MTTVYTSKPQALRSGEQIRVDDILQHKTVEDLIHFLIDRKVLQTAYLGLKALHTNLEKDLNLRLFETDDDLNQAILLVEKRNLVSHARGIVNKLFLQRVPQPGYAIGERLNFDQQQTEQALLLLAKSVARIDSTCIQKFTIPQTFLKTKPRAAQ